MPKIRISHFSTNNIPITVENSSSYAKVDTGEEQVRSTQPDCKRVPQPLKRKVSVKKLNS